MTRTSLANHCAFATSLAAIIWPVRDRRLVGTRIADSIMVFSHWRKCSDFSGSGRAQCTRRILPDTASAKRHEGKPFHWGELSGGLVLVRPGTRFPTDGAVFEGTADV